MGEPASVLVTGASGFIASHLIKVLLTAGEYKVRGTVRNLNSTEKLKPIKDLEPPDAKYPLELVEADLTKKDSWVEAVRGCTYIYHVASPFPGSGSDLTPEQQEERLIKPAVEGTLNVLQACAEVGGVKRVVVTSSVAAISCGMHGIPEKPKEYIYSEEDWSVESACPPYELSKLKAEKAAWEFVEKLEEDKKFELAVVNPSYVQGPLLSASSGGGTQLLCSLFLTGKMPAIPDIYFPIVDVRDVVAVHIRAMESPDAAGKRFLAYGGTLQAKEIATIMREEFKPQGYSVPSMPLPKIGMWVFKFFDQTARETYSIWGCNIVYNNERMKSLGVEPRPLKGTLLDTCYSLIELGLIPKKPRYRGPAQATDGTAGEDRPAESTETPGEAESKPAEGEEGSVKTEERPAEEKSAETEENPTETEEKPTESEDKPEKKPAESEDKPEEKPTESEDKPEKKPTESEDKPEEKPTESEDKPEEKLAETEDKPEEKPVESEDKPEEIPAESEDTPEEKPADSEEKPGETEENTA